MGDKKQEGKWAEKDFFVWEYPWLSSIWKQLSYQPTQRINLS